MDHSTHVHAGHRGARGDRVPALDQGQVTRLITALAHDIRTPLNSIMVTLKLLELKHGASFDDEDRADFARLQTATHVIVEWLSDLLDQVKLAGGGTVPEVTEFVPDAALASCLQVVRPLAVEKGLGLELDSRADGTFRSDRALFQHLVANLLSNAVRYTELGQITLRTRLDRDGLTVQVEDTGVGVRPEDLERIFEDFYRGPGVSGEGHGLGLSMARRTARLLGGELTVASEVGCGSVFSLRLPPLSRALSEGSCLCSTGPGPSEVDR
jgi:signal transduction histidine kinase